MKSLDQIKSNEKGGLDPEKHFKGRAVGIISASRGELSPETNAARNHELGTELHKRGFHVFPAKGHYTEQTPTPHDVVEDSHIVTTSHAGSDDNSIHSTLTELGKKYGQETFLHKPHDSDVASLHEPETGNSFPIGKLKMGRHGPNYSSLPNGKEFTFA